MGRADTDHETTAAVVAHGLLNAISVIAWSAGTLRDAWEELDPSLRGELLERIETQAVHVATVLNDLVRGLPPEARTLLEEIATKHDML